SAGERKAEREKNPRKHLAISLLLFSQVSRDRHTLSATMQLGAPTSAVSAASLLVRRSVVNLRE
ncbi:MAG: hypothetical protein ACTS5I_11065, partial [Rhodanobacter sp.]